MEKKNENQSQSALISTVSALGCSTFRGRLQAVVGGHYESEGIQCNHSSSLARRMLTGQAMLMKISWMSLTTHALPCRNRQFNVVICQQCQLLLDLKLLASHVKEKHARSCKLQIVIKECLVNLTSS